MFIAIARCLLSTPWIRGCIGHAVGNDSLRHWKVCGIVVYEFSGLFGVQSYAEAAEISVELFVWT